MRDALVDREGIDERVGVGVCGGFDTGSAEGLDARAAVRKSDRFVPLAPERRCGRDDRGHSRRPGPARPLGEPLRYLGAGVTMTRARGPHHRRYLRRSDQRSVTVPTTVALALLSALITAWLGMVAHLSDAVRDTSTPPLDRLAVVRVQSGETLPRLAERVAPGAPVDRVVKQIRDLNELDATALEAGRTLIAPVR